MPNIAPSRSKEKLEGGFLGSVDRHKFGGWIRPSCPCLIRCRQMSCTWKNVDGWLSETVRVLQAQIYQESEVILWLQLDARLLMNSGHKGW